MATQTTAAADAVLKVSYGKLHEQLRDDVPLWKNIERTADHITSGNTEAQFAINTRRNRGMGARNEMEDLPVAGNQKYARATLELKNYYARIAVSGQTFEQAVSNPQAFVDVVDREVTRAYTDTKVDMNRMAYGDGSGVLAAAVGANSATQVVDSVHWLLEDDVLDIVDLSALPTVTYIAQNVVVSTINTDTNTIVLTGSVNTGAGDMFVRAGNYGGKEIDGLSTLIGTQSLHGIDPATNSVWKSYVKTGVGDLEQVDMLRAIQGAARNGGKPSRIFVDFESFNSYWDLFEDKRRFTDDNPDRGGQNVEMTFKAGVLGSIPITPDFDAPAGTMFFVDESALVLNQVHDLKWMNRDGSMWSRIPNKDGYEAVLYWYGNLGTYRRNSHAKLTGINPLT